MIHFFRKTASATLSFAFLLGAAAPAVAQATPLGNGGGKYVNSQGQTSRFAFNAVRLPDGSANGHIVFHFPSGDAMVHMKVTSFIELGDQLFVVGPVTKAVNTPRTDLVGSTGFVAFQDRPGSDAVTGFSVLPRALGLLTALQVAAVLNLPPTGPVPPQFFLPLVKGNVKIH